MNTKLLIIFIVLNALNVVIQTVKSIVTVKCGKMSAAITNAVAYGLYTVVVVYMVCELPLLIKALVIGICNLIGVYVVKLVEEKLKKDKLWKVEITIPKHDFVKFKNILDTLSISYSTLEINDVKNLVLVYCNTQKESLQIKNLLEKFNVKYFVTESKIL